MIKINFCLSWELCNTGTYSLNVIRVSIQQNTSSSAKAHRYSGYLSTTCLNFTPRWNLRQRMGLSVFLDRYNLLIWDRKPTLKSKQMTFLFQIQIRHECFHSKNPCRTSYSSFIFQLLILTSSVSLTSAKSLSFTHFVNVRLSANCYILNLIILIYGNTQGVIIIAYLNSPKCQGGYW